jgi:hypothetical protein
VFCVLEFLGRICVAWFLHGGGAWSALGSGI